MVSIKSYFDKGSYEYSVTIGLIYFVTILLLVGIVNFVMSRFVYYATE